MELEYYAISHNFLGFYNGDKDGREFAPIEEKAPRLYRSIKDAQIQLDYLVKRGADRWDLRIVAVPAAFQEGA